MPLASAEITYEEANALRYVAGFVCSQHQNILTEMDLCVMIQKKKVPPHGHPSGSMPLTGVDYVVFQIWFLRNGGSLEKYV